MRFLGFLVIVLVVVLVAGYYLKWFNFSTANQGDKANISLEVDKQKIKADEQKAEQKLKELGQKAKESLPGKSEPNK